MLYILYSQQYDDYEFHGLFEGPSGLKIDSLHDKFMANFDHRTLWTPKRPDYRGPFTEVRRDRKPSSVVVTGSIGSGCLGDQPWPDASSPEYITWQAECRRADLEWQRQRSEKVKLFQQRYGGKDEFQMFLSYLKKEHGFKEVQAVLVNL